jgi:hypothetical protein
MHSRAGDASGRWLCKSLSAQLGGLVLSGWIIVAGGGVGSILRASRWYHSWRDVRVVITTNTWLLV